MASEQEDKRSMAEALLEEQTLNQPPAPEDHGGAPWPPSLLTLVCITFLTFSSAMAVSSWHRGYGAVAFVAFSYLDLVMLFYCLRLYERMPPAPESPRRELLKMVMWVLATMHTIAVLQLLEFWLLSIGTTEDRFD